MEYRYEFINLSNDLDDLNNLVSKAFSSTSDSSIKEWFSFSEMAQMIVKKRGICIKAIDNENNLIGMIYAQQESPINNIEGVEKWVIIMSAVSPEISGKGIGSGLLKAIENSAKEKKAKKMFVFTNLDDERVINFYKKNNYQDAGWIKDYQYGKGNSAVFLLKYL